MFDKPLIGDETNLSRPLQDNDCVLPKTQVIDIQKANRIAESEFRICHKPHKPKRAHRRIQTAFWDDFRKENEIETADSINNKTKTNLDFSFKDV